MLMENIFSWKLYNHGHYNLISIVCSWTLYSQNHYVLMDTIFSWKRHENYISCAQYHQNPYIHMNSNHSISSTIFPSPPYSNKVCYNPISPEFSQTLYSRCSILMGTISWWAIYSYEHYDSTNISSISNIYACYLLINNRGNRRGFDYNLSLTKVNLTHSPGDNLYKRDNWVHVVYEAYFINNWQTALMRYV